MAQVAKERSALALNPSSDWKVFTGKLPEALKKKLKVVSAETGQKQQEILAEAIQAWMEVKGF